MWKSSRQAGIDQSEVRSRERDAARRAGRAVRDVSTSASTSTDVRAAGESEDLPQPQGKSKVEKRKQAVLLRLSLLELLFSRLFFRAPREDAAAPAFPDLRPGSVQIPLARSPVLCLRVCHRLLFTAAASSSLTTLQGQCQLFEATMCNEDVIHAYTRFRFLRPESRIHILWNETSSRASSGL